MASGETVGEDCNLYLHYHGSLLMIIFSIAIHIAFLYLGPAQLCMGILERVVLLPLGLPLCTWLQLAGLPMFLLCCMQSFPRAMVCCRRWSLLENQFSRYYSIHSVENTHSTISSVKLGILFLHRKSVIIYRHCFSLEKSYIYVMLLSTTVLLGGRCTMLDIEVFMHFRVGLFLACLTWQICSANWLSSLITKLPFFYAFLRLNTDSTNGVLLW